MKKGRNVMATHRKSPKKKLKMRVSQGAVAKEAIHDIGLLYRKMGLNPKSVKNARKRLLAVSSVPAKLIEQVAAAADQHSSLAGIAFDADAAREALAYASAFGPVANEAEAFAQRVRDSIIVAKSAPGASALVVYTALKGFVRSAEGAELRGAFDSMTAIMKERRNVGKRVLQKHAAAVKSRTPKAAATPTSTEPTPTPSPTAHTDKNATTTVVINTPGGVA
jgi:hypothetical protein